MDVFLKKYYMKFLYSDTSSLGIVYLGAASTVSIEYLLAPPISRWLINSGNCVERSECEDPMLQSMKWMHLKADFFLINFKSWKTLLYYVCP